MRHLLCTLFTFALFACSQSESYDHYINFPKEIALRSEVIELDTVLLRYPFRVTVRDSLVVVLDMHNNNNFLHAFTYPEWKHIVSFGKRGEGTQEMLSAETLCFLSLDSIWVLDPNKTEITRWRISPESKVANQEEIIKLDKRLIRTLDFYPTKAGFIVPDYTGEDRYCTTNATGQYLRSAGETPTEKRYNRTPQIILAQAWRSFIDYNPTKNILVMATQLGEVVEIYNLNDSTHTAIYGPSGEPEFHLEQTEMIPTGIMGFSDVQITDTYIYAVFHGRRFEDIALSYQQGIKPESGGREIQVFDLAGKPVKRYRLDRAIYGIDVDEQNKTITATDVNANEPIVRFNLE